MKITPRRLAAPECQSGDHQYVVDECDVGIFIYDEPNDAFYSQEVEHQAGTSNWLSEIGVKISRKGWPKAPDGSDAVLIVGVTKDAPPSNPYVPDEYHAYMVISPSDLPAENTEYWFSMAFDPLDIDGTSAFITVVSNAELKEPPDDAWCWCGDNTCNGFPCLLWWTGSNWAHGVGYRGNFYSCTQDIITSCTANWRETDPTVGDTIHADFTWANAVWHQTGEFFCSMAIYDPNGALKAHYVEEIDDTGSHTLEVIANIPGQWECIIKVWDGTDWVTCTDYVAVTEDGEYTLDEALTCEWVNGYNDHGPLVTEFDIGELVYAYAEIHGPDMYGKTMKHEWWYKEAGQSNFTKRWEWSKTCTSHYTEWATWTWWDIGGDIGPGEGYIKVYLDDVYMGKTNNYTIGATDVQIVFRHDLSTWYTGPYSPGDQNVLLAEAWFENIGTETSSLIHIKTYAYPGQANETLLDDTICGSYAPGEIDGIQIKGDIPLDAPNPLPLGIKIWDESEPEPPWGSLGTKIFKIRRS